MSPKPKRRKIYKTKIEIMTTRLTGGLNRGYKPNYKPAPQDAGFHFVQA